MKRGRPKLGKETAKIVPIRMPDEMKQALLIESRLMNLDLSSLVRLLVERFLRD